MSKRNRIIYWIATIWLALGMVSTGIVQLLKEKSGQGGADTVLQLGYPVYFLPMLGFWKMLGVIAILVPKFPVLKEWAYAGFFFAMSGAIFSHLAAGSAREIFPATLLLLLTVVSWYFRPAGRRMSPVLTANLKQV